MRKWKVQQLRQFHEMKSLAFSSLITSQVTYMIGQCSYKRGGKWVANKQIVIYEDMQRKGSG